MLATTRCAHHAGASLPGVLGAVLVRCIALGGRPVAARYYAVQPLSPPSGARSTSLAVCARYHAVCAAR
jgi:hypothetical protein